MRRNPRPLALRVAEAADRALAADGYVAALDVIGGIGWVDGGTVNRWRQGRIDCLESAIQTHPARLAEALGLFRAWAAGKGLIASEVQYVARTPDRPALRFSRGGDPAVERFYRTHWLSPALPEAKRERLAEKSSRAPELVVQPLKPDWRCHRCGGSGDLLIMEDPGPACLRCAGLADLAFLPAGDALLTRRAKARSARHAVVVRFSRSRKRYERQGLLVEPQALREAEGSLERE